MKTSMLSRFNLRTAPRQPAGRVRRWFSIVLLAVSLLGLLAVPSNRAPAQDTDESQESDDTPLPKLEEMPLPTAAQLIRDQPVDWIVTNSDRVIVTQLIYPRPNTLAKLKAEILQLRKGPPGTREERKQKRAELRLIDVVLPGENRGPEYQILMKKVKEIVYHEELMLRRIDMMVQEGKMSEAYSMLFSLKRLHPNWPGIDERHNRLIFAEADVRLKLQQPEAALVFFEELHGRNPKYPGLKLQLANVADLLISNAMRTNDYRRARHFLARLSRKEPEHEVVANWKNRLRDQSTQMIGKARQAADDGKHDHAARTIHQAAHIWPSTPGLRNSHRRITNRFQQLKVGVLRLPGERSAYILPTDADLRYRSLTQGTLFEVSRSEEVPRYRSRFFEQWEPTDLGRRAVFTLRRTRATWESQPIVTASSIVSTFAARLDPDNAAYDERFDNYIQTMTVQSPFEFQVQFSRVPLRIEALFNFPLLRPRTNNSNSELLISRRFQQHKRTKDRLVYRRWRPEPDGVSEYHVAEVVEIKQKSHAEAIQSLLRGKVSMLPHVRSQDVPRLRDDGRFFVQQYVLPVTHVLQVNPKSRPLRNRELRRALAYSLNRPHLLKKFILHDPNSERGRVVTGPFSTRSYAYNSLIVPREYDLRLALHLTITATKRLKGKLPKLRMVCAPDPNVEAAAAEFVRQWARIGITVELVKQPPRNGHAPNWDILYRTVRMVEPLTDLWPFLTLESRARVKSLSYLPDSLRMELIELDNAGNWNSAVKKIKRLHQLLWGEVQIIPLWEVDDYLVIRKNITGFPAQPMRTYHDIERWIVKPWYPTQTL
jgi:hypothetical protein